MADQSVNSTSSSTTPGYSPVPGVDPNNTTLEGSQANIRLSSQVFVDQFNADLKARYLSAFNDWTISVNAGRIDNSNPPKPPKAYRLSAPDANGYVWPEIGTDPVCDMPPVPPNRLNPPEPPAGTIDVGADLGGGYFAAGPHDRVAPGTVITLPNGLKLVKIGYFMGNGWYQRVA